MKNIIAASILSANFAHLGDDVRAALACGVDRIHFDVMDHHFVPNLSFGALVCRALRDDGITAPIDAHLMVEHPEKYIEAFAKCGASMIVFHAETTEDVNKTIESIHQAGMQAGLAFSPEKTLRIDPSLLAQLEIILIMSVNPGFGGQKFMPSAIEKISHAHKLITQYKPNILLGVDGGIKTENIAQVAKAGVNYFVVGSGLFHCDNYQLQMDQLRRAIETSH